MRGIDDHVGPGAAQRAFEQIGRDARFLFGEEHPVDFDMLARFDVLHVPQAVAGAALMPGATSPRLAAICSSHQA